MDTNGSVVSSDFNTSSHYDDIVTIRLYSAVSNCVLLLLLFVPGLLANGAVLLSSRCKKGVRCLQYGLHYATFAVSLLLCAVWLPLHVAMTLSLYASGGSSSGGSHPALCMLNLGLLHFCLASIVALCVSLGALHLNYLSSSPVPELRKLVARSLAGSLATALLLAILAMAEQAPNYSNGRCANTFISATLIAPSASWQSPSASEDSYTDEHSIVEDDDIAKESQNFPTYTIWYSIMSIVLAVAYSTTLLIMIVVLWLALHALRTRLAEMTPYKCRDARVGGTSDSIAADDEAYEISRGDEPSKHSSVTFKEPEVAETIPDNGGGRICSMRKSPSPKTLKFAKSPGDSDEEDDASFDRKMRIRMQKSGSGRRHTVANIGLGDSSHRRGSLDVPANGPNCAKSYNYIRKWSVDITALQAQLENPRTHSGSYPFRDLGILPENPKKSSPDSINEVDESEENATGADSTEAPTNDTPVEQTSSNNNSNGLANESTKQCDRLDKEPLQKPTKSNGCHKHRATAAAATTQDSKDAIQTASNTHNTIEEEDIEPDKPLLSHVPSIIINENPQTFSIDKQGDMSPCRNQTMTDTSLTDEDIRRRLYKQIRKTKHYIILYFITLILMCPLLCAYLVQPLLGPHLLLNLTATLAPLVAAFGITHPLYLAWMDTRLHNAMARLWIKLTHWTCVCYCNIGKGKRLFGKPSQPQQQLPDTSTATGAVASTDEKTTQADIQASVC